MRLRRQGVYTLAATGRVYEFETTGGIVLCRFSSVAGPDLAVVPSLNGPQWSLLHPA
jgi:hypothetical protein